MNAIKCFVKKNAKAIVSGVVTAVTYFAVHAGLNVTPDAAVAIAAAVGAVVVWFTRNTKC